MVGPEVDDQIEDQRQGASAHFTSIIMHITLTSMSLLATLLLFAAHPVYAETPEQQGPNRVQVIQVQGSDLTGLNLETLSGNLQAAHRQGAVALVLDLGSLTHMTEAGMQALVSGAEIFGRDRFAVANLSGAPAELLKNQGAGRIQVFPTVEEAVAALSK